MIQTMVGFQMNNKEEIWKNLNRIKVINLNIKTKSFVNWTVRNNDIF